MYIENGKRLLDKTLHLLRSTPFHTPWRTSLYTKAETFMRFGGHPHAPRRTNELIKASWTKDEEHFQKALQRFENALSSFWGIIFGKNLFHLLFIRISPHIRQNSLLLQRNPLKHLVYIINLIIFANKKVRSRPAFKASHFLKPLMVYNIN